MLDPQKTKYVCIHGHFYQPPRENPWLDEVEMEASAAPRHDWNERITQECYRANAAARLVDSDNRILTLRNNYRSLSFNFGPTLLTWLERHAPWVYNTILEADQESCQHFNGHGNAMAQVYNHLIMPLANQRDKLTQVRWGVRDFQHRFGRLPEGMWLAETAVDLETLRVLAEAGIRFTILSPFQAARWRFMTPQGSWHDAAGGTIPTGRPYRCTLGEGRFIDLFFYDAQLAQGLAFERLLEHSSKVVEAVEALHQRRGQEPGPWLAHAATDGESYGHHFRFGDMALAAALRDLEQNPLVQITNYSAFLAAFPPIAEVQVREHTAWSCAHGVGRWQTNCGCRIGGDPGWDQKWRAPLRAALNQLRDQLALHYEQGMGRLTRDPWQVRDEYIEVLLNPAPQRDAFVRRHTRRRLPAAERCRFLQLLEMQRSALFMFTSCGWFFDEISGLESLIILRHAARAMQLAAATGAADVEGPFLKILAQAPSNRAEYRDGADVYLKKVKPEIVAHERVVANYAMRALLRPSHNHHRLYCYHLSPRHADQLGPNPLPCLLGSISITDERTEDASDFLFGVVHFGSLDFRCSVKPMSTPAEYGRVLTALEFSAEEQNTVKMMRILDETFGGTSYNLNDCFRDYRQELAREISQQRLKIYADFQRHLYEENRSLMWSLNQLGVRIPMDLRTAVRRVLSVELAQLVRELLEHDQEEGQLGANWEEADFYARARIGRLHAVLQEARTWELELNVAGPENLLGEAMAATLTSLVQQVTAEGCGKLLRLIRICKDLQVKPQLWKLQTCYYRLVQTLLAHPASAHSIAGLVGFLDELDAFLDCRFRELLKRKP
jgi:alpha-amylase/alpha-mannosidase (GH57 family)